MYRSYGIHWCANVVVGPAAEGAAVLIRGVTIETGLDAVRRRRGGVADRVLTDGPGKLCQALAIDRSIDGVAMARSAARIYSGAAPEAFRTTPRIGITKAADWPLRFVVAAVRAEGAGRPVRPARP